MAAKRHEKAQKGFIYRVFGGGVQALGSFVGNGGVGLLTEVLHGPDFEGGGAIGAGVKTVAGGVLEKRNKARCVVEFAWPLDGCVLARSFSSAAWIWNIGAS